MSEVSLTDIAKRVDLSLSLDELAQNVQLRKLALNSFVAGEILRLFKWSVGSTVAIVVTLVIIDAVMVWTGHITPEKRMVTEHVLLALIGSSVVQVGAASAAIVYGLFGKPNADEDA